jgi:hypothetical protein
MAFSWSVKEDLLCAELPAWSSQKDICFPGGACVSNVITNIQSIPAPSEIILGYMSQLGPAMSFLNPFFMQLDTVLAIFRCIEGITDFATSLDPSGIIECIPELVEKVNNLLNMIPQLSMPRMIIALIETVENLLRFLANDLEYIQFIQQRTTDAIDLGVSMGDNKLGEILACAEANMDAQLQTTAEALKSIGRIIMLLNIFLGLIGGPEIPCFGEVLSDPEQLDSVIDVLRELADLLGILRAAIPDPQMVITVALGEQSC